MDRESVLRKIENSVIAIEGGGISNRLKCLISAMRIADNTSRKLVLFWPADKYISCNFSDLFENEIVEIDPVEYGILDQIVDLDKRCRMVYPWRFKLLPEDELPELFSRHHPFGIGRYIDLEYERIPLEIRKKYLVYVNRLHPKKYITDEVERFRAKYGQYTVGVHIRTWPEIEARRRSELFDINNIFKIIDKTKDSNIFISSDSEQIQMKLVDRYGKRILFYPKRSFLNDINSKDEPKDALVDLLLLSKCKELHVSYLSTYSEMSWWLGGCEAKVKVIPNKGYIIRTIDIACGYKAICLFNRYYYVRTDILSVIIDKIRRRLKLLLKVSA